jgi:peptide methionine sulfoxide reductase MsrA
LEHNIEVKFFILNDNQKKIAEKVLKDVNLRLSGKVVTKISLLKNYCPAEEYHQKYLEKR